LSYFVVVLGFLVCVFLVCSDGFDCSCCFQPSVENPRIRVVGLLKRDGNMARKTEEGRRGEDKTKTCDEQ
jgi:hypothetical protein